MHQTFPSVEVFVSNIFWIDIKSKGICGEGNGNPLQYSCLEKFMDRGAWQAAVHGVTKESDTIDQLSNSSKTILTVGEPVELASSSQPRVCKIAL